MGWLLSQEQSFDSKNNIKLASREAGEHKSIDVEMKKHKDPVDMGPLTKYHITPKILGAGGFGKVFLAWSVDDPDIKFAIKAIKKRSFKVSLEDVKREIEFLSTLDHPHIIKYFEAFQDSKYVYIVTEYCPNGDLFDLIKKRVQEVGSFKESRAAEMMKTLLKTVHYLHSKKIAHRDIKPENIMIGDDNNLKLIDFGISKQVEHGDLTGIVGSSYYIAPEVIQDKYGRKWDIWSLGVILYILLWGYLPFNGANTAKILDDIKESEIKFTHKEWEKVTPEGKDLVKWMLDPDQHTRYTASECLNHKWFKVAEELENDEERDVLDSHIVRNIKNYKAGSFLRK